MSLYDKTIRELQALGITTTFTIYPSSGPLIQEVFQPDPEPSIPATPPPPTQATPPPTQADYDKLAAILNEVAQTCGPLEARKLIGEGTQLEDITDLPAVFSAAKELLNAA